jgi:lipid-binding SYLF domain-containing protein
VSIEGVVINRDDDTNEAVYGEPVSARKVLLEERYALPEAGRGFIDALNQYSPERHPER